MQEYVEYARGKDYLKDTIILYSEFENAGGLKDDCYYPVISTSLEDDDERAFVESISHLPMKRVKVCLLPNEPPQDMEVFIEEDWAYSIKEI